MKRLMVLATVVWMGCVSAPKKIAPDPATAPPESFTASAEPGADVIEQWWKDFGQPGLEQTVTGALDRNYDLQAAAARVGQAAARARIAGADLKPSLGAGFNGARRRQNFVGLPIPGNEGGVLTSTSTTCGVSLDVSWKIDLWGRLSARAQAAVADLQVSAADYAGARLSVAGQTAKTWFAIAESAEQVQLSEDTVAAFEGTVARARRRFESGVGPSVDLRLALSNLAAAKALLEQNRQRLDATTRQLEILVGRYPGAAIERPDTLPSLPESVPGGLPAELLARRPDLVAAERRLAAADSRWHAAKGTSTRASASPPAVVERAPSWAIWRAAISTCGAWSAIWCSRCSRAAGCGPPWTSSRRAWTREPPPSPRLPCVPTPRSSRRSSPSNCSDNRRVS